LKPVFLFCLMPTKLEAIFVEATPSGISFNQFLNWKKIQCHPVEIEKVNGCTNAVFYSAATAFFLNLNKM
jgi:hypothetical protein